MSEEQVAEVSQEVVRLSLIQEIGARRSQKTLLGINH